MTDPFHPLSVRDIPLLTRYFSRQDTRLCNASAGAAVLWQPYFQDAALELDGTLLLPDRTIGPDEPVIGVHIPAGADISHAARHAAVRL